MLKHTIMYVNGPRTMSDKESECVRHSQHATTKYEADAVAKGVGGFDGVVGYTR